MKRILLTCGIGDFIAMESHAPAVEREEVTAIHWATRARESLMELVPFVFPNVEEHVIERDTWGAPFTDDFCISSIDQLPDLDTGVEDWSVKIVADEIRSGLRCFHGSSLLRQPLCSVDELHLPTGPFFVMHPFSENARTVERDLSLREWVAALRYIKSRGYGIVIVNKGGERMPLPFEAVDLSDKLTLLETIEVTKRAAGFIGCASFPAVIAAQSLTSDWLFVKSNRSVKRFYFWLYYAPQESNAFVTDDLLKIIPRG